MKIFLIGFMGSGKSYSGRRLAKAMRYTFIDLDDEIEAKAKLTISEIFDQFGEIQFRKLEQQTLQGLKQKSNTIIACGGGTPCFYNNMDWINENGMSVYLKTPASLLAKRLLKGIDKRPLLHGQTKEKLISYIESKIKERAPYYQQAHVIFDQSTASIDFVKDFITRLPGIVGH